MSMQYLFHLIYIQQFLHIIHTDHFKQSWKQIYLNLNIYFGICNNNQNLFKNRRKECQNPLFISNKKSLKHIIYSPGFFVLFFKFSVNDMSFIIQSTNILTGSVNEGRNFLYLLNKYWVLVSTIGFPSSSHTFNQSINQPINIYGSFQPSVSVLPRTPFINQLISLESWFQPSASLLPHTPSINQLINIYARFQPSVSVLPCTPFIIQ